MVETRSQRTKYDDSISSSPEPLESNNGQRLSPKAACNAGVGPCGPITPSKVTKKCAPNSKSSKNKGDRLRQAFANHPQIVRQAFIRLPPPIPNVRSNADYTEVFLCHAKVYVFADEKDVQPLRILALEELRAALSVFTLHEARMGDIMALVSYAYENTYYAGDKLRALLGEYMTLEASKLMRNESFKALILEHGGALYDDFMSYLAQRLE